ncbi:MAG: fumarylacetoacetate hydrolase family protein [Bdellovibrionaceae bacterium]|nr:fumarylacetoacetate hydrolase family protein [Pseudobdellovibrionaceae bacterium]MDW8190628.1 fumarylacetoacetate hydrolase family protein [Pseudobdellovibrionaceae bacterium]
MVIRNIWCVGRNFLDHVQEIGAEMPQEPIIFLKAGSSATVGSSEIWLPYWTEEVHYELELALRFDAFLKIKEAALALDLTERRYQREAKQKGLPWTRCKSFDEACPITPTFLIRSLESIKDTPYRLWINGQLRQEAIARHMHFPLEFLVQHLEEFYPVTGGDFLLTGTPAGSGPLQPGDEIKVQFLGEITHIWKVFKHQAPSGDR